MEVKTDGMFAELRKQNIVDIVNKNNKVTVKELCSLFNVSQATIRNDLRELDERLLLTRAHGGAIKKSKTTHELNAYEKEVEHMVEKRLIAKAAMAYIYSGDSIALDTGSTTFEIAKQLVTKKNITVVTNDLQIAAFLEKNSNVNIIMAGGAVRRNFHCTAGKAAIDTISNLYVDKAFMATNGLSFEKGFTTPNIDTAAVKKVMKNSADQVFCVADSSKIDVSTFVKFMDINSIDVLITDSGISPEFIRKMQSLDIIVDIADIK